MKAVVLYESVYGNTEAVARAVAEGLAALVTNSSRLRRYRVRPLPAEGRPLAEVPGVEVGEHEQPGPPVPATDPVYGMEVDPETAAGSAEFEGVTYL